MQGGRRSTELEGGGTGREEERRGTGGGTGRGLLGEADREQRIQTRWLWMGRRRRLQGGQGGTVDLVWY